MHSSESEICYRTIKHAACRRVCVHFFFSPEISQAGTVKGLKRYEQAKLSEYYSIIMQSLAIITCLVSETDNVSLLVPAGLTLTITGYTDPLYM